MKQHYKATVTDAVSAAGSFFNLLACNWRMQRPVINIMADRITFKWSNLTGDEHVLITAIEKHVGIERELVDGESNGSRTWVVRSGLDEGYGPAYFQTIAQICHLGYDLGGQIVTNS